jgi:DNA-nicking Smr family endonuclease
MNRKHALSEDERRLFRDSVTDAKPLKTTKRPLRRPKLPPPKARFADVERRAVLEDSLKYDLHDADAFTGEDLWYARPGIQHALMRKLRRGQFSSRAELDLHGLRSEEARRTVMEFLQAAHERNLRCVRIIHGKGRGSGARGPVLKQKLAAWLQQRRDVLAFCSARPADGGSGALYVLLSRD